MTTDLTEALTAAAHGNQAESAAVWLLTEHGHWIDGLQRAGLIHIEPGNPGYASIIWQQVATQCLLGPDAQIHGTPSEWQVLRIACMLTGRHALSLADLTSLDNVNVRLVLLAIGSAARGQEWAMSLFTPPASPQISFEVANHVLWHFSQGGLKPGSFTTHLMMAFATADPMRRAQLMEAFPAYGWAMHLAQNTERGIGQLRVIADGGPKSTVEPKDGNQ